VVVTVVVTVVVVMTAVVTVVVVMTAVVVVAVVLLRPERDVRSMALVGRHLDLSVPGRLLRRGSRVGSGRSQDHGSCHHREGGESKSGTAHVCSS
jgi:uncharacterized membrane protein YgcG